MVRILLLLVANIMISVLASTSWEEAIKQHEGYERCAYIDTSGLLHIGYGHLITDTRLREGDCLPAPTLESMFKLDVHKATKVAEVFVSNWESQPSEVQYILVDMAYNLGPKGLGEFVELKKHIEDYNYHKAAEAMLRSRWYNQVGVRSKKLVSIMLEVNSAH